MYLDFDTTPPLRSHDLRVKRLATAIEAATLLIRDATEGQIGIYDTPRGDGFHGYVIKYAGKDPYFEAATGEVA